MKLIDWLTMNISLSAGVRFGFHPKLELQIHLASFVYDLIMGECAKFLQSSLNIFNGWRITIYWFKGIILLIVDRPYRKLLLLIHWLSIYVYSLRSCVWKVFKYIMSFSNGSSARLKTNWLKYKLSLNI